MILRALYFMRRKIRALHILVTSQISAQQFRWWGAKVGRRFRAFGRLHLTIEDYANITIGSNVTIRPGVRIYMISGTTLIIEDNVEIKSNVCMEIAGTLILRKGCVLVNGTLIYANGHIEIGENTMIAGQCVLVDANHGMELGSPMKLQPITPPRPIYISDDVWIGAGSTVLQGVTIGAHSIIGANSVVSRDVPPYTIAVGSPAKVVRERRNTPQAQVEQPLQESV